MSSPVSASDRKRKPDEVMSSNNCDDQSNSKARRVSTDAQPTTVASDETTDEPPAANVVSTEITAPEPSMEIMGQLIQDLFHSDNARVNAALDALNSNLVKDMKYVKKKCEIIHAVGGCSALVQLVKNCLDTVIARIPALDHTPKDFELETLDKSIGLIACLTCHLDVNTIAAIGGVEAIVKTIKHFQSIN